MKVLFFVAIAVGLASAAPSKRQEEGANLRPAVEQILALVDLETIQNVLNTTDLTTCENYTRLHDYLAGPKYNVIHNHLWTDSEWLDVFSFIANAGFPEVYDGFNAFFERMDLPYRVGAEGPISGLTAKAVRGGEVCNETALRAIILEAVPMDKILPVVLELIGVDSSVQDLLILISEPEKGAAYREFKALDEVQDLINAVRETGVPIDALLNFIESLFQWGEMQTLEGEDDLRPAVEKILSMVDMESIVEAINRTDLSTCENLTLVKEYLGGEKYGRIHNHIWTEAEWLDVMAFIADANIPEVYDGFNAFFERMELPYRVGRDGPIKAPLRITRGTEQCDEEALAAIVQAAVPLDKILPVVLELIGVDASIQNLLILISEPEKGAAYFETKALPEVQDLIAAATEAGLPVELLLNFIENLFWSQEGGNRWVYIRNL